MDRKEFIKECNFLAGQYQVMAFEIRRAITRYELMQDKETYEELKEIVEKYKSS